MRGIILFCTLWLSVAPAIASLPFTDEDYAIDIPTFESVLGYAAGDEITTPENAVRYLERLRDAAPDRIKIIPYAESWQGRQLVYAVIASKDNIARLDAIKADLAALSDGTSLTASERERRAAELPAVSWLAYGVHGNELSPTDAGLALSYHLLASKSDARVSEILEHTIVIVDPIQNPDGRARFVHGFEAARGLAIQGDTYAAERDEPWPSGRFNHALFDMNRDWFTLSQPETRGRVSAMLEWHPTVVVDAHEMGSQSTYFFAPAARPFSPFLTKDQLDGHELIGRANADAFDKAGIRYFTREVYDMFYPGYGETWPALNGAVAMTYEQASSRGLAYRRADGSVLTYADAVRNHFLATLTTAWALADNKNQMLLAYADRRASAIAEGKSSPNRYTVIDRAVRPSQADDFAMRMMAQGISVRMSAAGDKVCGQNYSSGALVVDRAAPNGRLISTLLDNDTPLAKDYIEQQEKRRSSGYRHQLYDVTGWSVPLMDGLSAQTCARLEGSRLAAFRPLEATALPPAEFGYALAWDDAGQAKFLIAALQAGLRARSTDQPFQHEGITFGAGSLVFSKLDNGADLQGELDALLQSHPARLVPMQKSWVDEGPNFGSAHFREVRLPRVALAWGMGTSPLSAGATRHVVERNLGLAVTPIRVRSMAYADLSAFDVIILPETGRGFAALLGGGAKALKSYVADGGLVLALGSATRAIASDNLSLLPVKRERRPGQNGSSDASTSDLVPGTELWSEDDYAQAIASGAKTPDTVPGALLHVEVHRDHWMAFGYDKAITLFRGSTIYAPLKEDEGTNVFRYADAEGVLASGYLWTDVRNQLARKPFVMAKSVGSGAVVAFAQDPTVRAYQHGLELMIANGLLQGPAHAN